MPQRMAAVLANLNASIADKAGASPLLVGTGKDEVHLLVVMTAERGLCGGFNSNIARLARQDALRLAKEGKTVKIMCVGRKGADALRRDWGRQIVDRVDLKARQAARPSPTPRTSPTRCWPCSRPASSTSPRSTSPSSSR